ncbi:hypothetical protein RhiirB3_456639 [Rhizophagus irregularis]|nr:hypothetical protein RhiirB3_456639 [Rhizophagus irregularis]
MNITHKLKTTLRSSNLPTSMYIPYSSLPPLTLHDLCDSRTDWLKNLMKYGLPWFNHFLVASTLVKIYQGGRSGEI